jgi:hypothetical protein
MRKTVLYWKPENPRLWDGRLGRSVDLPPMRIKFLAQDWCRRYRVEFVDCRESDKRNGV